MANLSSSSKRPSATPEACGVAQLHLGDQILGIRIHRIVGGRNVVTDVGVQAESGSQQAGCKKGRPFTRCEAWSSVSAPASRRSQRHARYRPLLRSRAREEEKSARRRGARNLGEVCRASTKVPVPRLSSLRRASTIHEDDTGEVRLPDNSVKHTQHQSECVGGAPFAGDHKLWQCGLVHVVGDDA